MSIADRLAAMNDAYKAAPVADGGSFELPPDGDYSAIIDRFDTFEGKNGPTAGHLFLKTEMKIVHNDEFEGRQVSVVHNLEDPMRLDQLKRHLAILGLDPDGFNFSELFDQLSMALDLPCEIAIKTSTKTNPSTGKFYRNVYLNRVFGTPMRKNEPTKSAAASDLPPAPAAASVPVDDTEVPF